MVDNLIATIGRQLNIPQSPGSEWICQIIYSLAGKMALASLWDHSEDEDTISLQHFKKRVLQIIDAYTQIYPQVDAVLQRNKDALAEEIYTLYLRTGCLYHSAYKLSPAAPSVSRNNRIHLYRGAAPGANLFLSGLGSYSIQDSNVEQMPDVMFGLQVKPYSEHLHELLDSGSWEQVDWPESTQFLKIEPPFSGGYWQTVPNKSKISLARYGEPNRVYVFYRFYNGAYQQMPIPAWCLCDFQSPTANNNDAYRIIATALLMEYGQMPLIRVASVDGYKIIRLGYRLPPAEEAFLKLYSWPLDYDFSDGSGKVFSRKMAKDIFPLFKAQFEKEGYHFVEV